MNEDQWKIDPTTENEQPENETEEQPASEREAVTESRTAAEVETAVEPDKTAGSETVTDLYASPNIYYETQSSRDIYTTPGTERIGTGGVFSGYQNQSDYASQDNVYQNQTYDTQGSPYQNQPYDTQGSSYQNQPYGTQGSSYQNQPYDTQGSPYQNQPYGTQGSPYQNQAYGTQGSPYQNQAYGTQGSPYQNQPYGTQGSSYQNQPYDTQGSPYQNQPYGTQGSSYQNQPYGTQGSSYQNQTYGTQGNPYQNQPYGAQGNYNNPYSPYAVPGQHKKHTGLIIGVIVGIVILFLIAIFSVIYYALKHIDGRIRGDSYAYDRDYEYFDEYDFDYDDHDNWRSDRRRNEYFKDNDYDNDKDYDDDDDQDKYGEYYELEDALRYDLSYSVSWEYYEYEPENDEDVMILVEYPVIEGDSVPNLDRINDLIYEEVDDITDYYEEDYAGYMREDSYFYAYAEAYVTYMDEDVLSIVYSEEVDCDYYPYVNLYCINVDMRNGVVMDNTELLNIDDDFSVDFRNRSEKQNGSISGLDYMSDQMITGYLTDSASLIVFYTPLGMEIGMNYDEGWVTVTYKDYEQYLKIF